MGTRATRPSGARTPSAVVPLVTSLFTSIFLHGGLLHLLGNMLFLWVFGTSVEDHLGHLPYIMCYLICGLGAGVTHILANWGSTIPSIGASGAISGATGAYIVLFPRSKILTLVPIVIFFFMVRLLAVLILGYWFLIQFLSGFLSLGEVDQTGVAWWAHIGGFLLGAFLAWGFLKLKLYLRLYIPSGTRRVGGYSSMTLLTVSCSTRSRRG